MSVGSKNGLSQKRGFLVFLLLLAGLLPARAFQIFKDIDGEGYIRNDSVRSLIVPLTLLTAVAAFVLLTLSFRKVSLPSKPAQSTLLGILSLFPALALIADNVFSLNKLLIGLPNAFPELENNAFPLLWWLTVVTAVLGFLAAVYLLVLFLTFVGYSKVYTFKWLSAFLPLWASLSILRSYIMVTDAILPTEAVYDLLIQSALALFLIALIRVFTGNTQSARPRLLYGSGSLLILLAILLIFPRYLLNFFRISFQMNDHTFNICLIAFSAFAAGLLIIFRTQPGEQAEFPEEAASDPVEDKSR